MKTSLMPAVPFSESPEEWIELYNKGTAAVDLSGWKFTDGITYTMPNGTTIPAGGYLVVAKDAAALQAEHPTIAIVGNFSGTLSNIDRQPRAQRQLSVTLSNNVQYFDSANWHENGRRRRLQPQAPLAQYG